MKGSGSSLRESANKATIFFGRRLVHRPGRRVGPILYPHTLAGLKNL